MIADKLAAVNIDIATWEDQLSGYQRVVFSPDFWPTLETLVRAAEELEEPCPADNWNFAWEKRVQAASARLRAALAELDKVLS
jgi:hypothetical protein